MSELERRLIEACRRLPTDDQEALIQIARFRTEPVKLEFNKGAPEVGSAREYASSLANRALTQIGEMLRLGSKATISAQGIVGRVR